MPKQKVTSNRVQAKVKTTNGSQPSPETQLKVPSQSLTRAKSVFKNFTLSAPDEGAPRTMVAPGKQVSSVQKSNIISHLKSLDASGRKLRLALSDTDLKTLLPSFDGKTVDLKEVINLIQRRMSGTEFYVAGNSTLARLAVQSQAGEIIQNIKSEPVDGENK